MTRSCSTRRAATLLGAADVVLHDWLSGADVLALARPGATLIDVGKGKGCGASQRYIERLIVAHHGAGSRVVRLKGGDPFLFGRGMEEVRAARSAGFDVEVVPGISSSLGAPALAGIAVTERGVSAQVTILSGHRVEADNDWSTLARLDGTLVVLMAATHRRCRRRRAAPRRVARRPAGGRRRRRQRPAAGRVGHRPGDAGRPHDAAAGPLCAGHRRRRRDRRTLRPRGRAGIRLIGPPT